MRLNAAPASFADSIPSIVELPDVGRRMFIISLIMVVLPAPFAPISA